MKRKILAALLAFCLVLSLFPIGAFAAETETPAPGQPASKEATVKVGTEEATTELVNGVHYVQPEGTLKMVASGDDGSESPNINKYGYYPAITMPEIGENDLIIFSRSYGVANKTDADLSKLISDNAEKLAQSETGRVSGGGDTLAEWYEILTAQAFNGNERPYWPEISRDPNVQIVWAHGEVADSTEPKAGETDGSSSPEAEATSSPTEAPTEQPEAPNVTYTSYDRYMFDFNAVTLELPIKLTPVTNEDLGKAGVTPVPATELQTGVKTSGSTGANTTTASGANLVVTGTSNYVDLTWFGTDRTAGNYVALKVEKASEQMPDIKEAYITLSDKTEKKIDPDGIIIWQFSEEKTEQGIPTNAYIPLKLVYQKEGAEGTSSLRLAINCAQMKLEGPVAKLYPAILTDGWQNQTTREPTATLGEDGKVTITAENLKEHKNGNNTDGHWIGFALTAPAGADKVKYGFDVDEASANAKFEKATPGALEGNVHETERGIAFYADAGAEKPKTVAIVEWYKGDQKILGPTTYTMDLSGVTLAPEGTQLNVTAAVGDDLLGKADTDIQSDIKATVGADGVIKLTGSSKYIAGWEGFSSVEEQQNGHYVALTLAAGEGAKISFKSPTEDNKVKEFTTSGTVAWRLENFESGTIEVTVTMEKGEDPAETKVYTIDMSGIDRLPGVISKAENQDKEEGAVGVRYAEGTIYLSGGVTFDADATTAEVKADIFVGETKVHTETLTITKNGEELSVAPTTFEAVGNELTVDIDNLFVKNENSTAYASIAAAPEAKVSDSIPEENKTAATAVLTAISDAATEIEKAVLAEYAAKIANDETRPTKDLLKAVPAETRAELAKLENSTNDGIKKIANAVKVPDNYKGDDIKTVVQVRVDIEISGIELGENGKPTSLTLDITPVAETLLTTASDPGATAPKVLNSTNSAQANAIVISKEPVSIDKPVRVTIKLSDAFAEGNDYVIKHIKENPAGKYFYDGSVNSSHVLTFTSLHGFSQVTVYSTDPRVASIGEVKYETLQEAVDAVQEGEIITLLADAAGATITKLVNFTIDPASYSTGTIIVPPGMRQLLGADGKLTFVVDSGSSGGTYYPPAYPGNPTPTPTPTPTANPSAEPTSAPSTEPTADPSAEPTSEPSAEPTVEPTTDPSDVDFKDLNKASNDEARQAIKKAVVMGLLQGYSDGTFRPRNGITRWEFAVVMARADLVKNGAKGTPSELNAMLLKQYPNGCKFTDVMNNSNLSDIVRAGIAYCADHKIMDGRSSATFDPTTGITRQEAALTLAKWAKLNMKDTDLSMFEDGSAVSSWAKGGVKAAYKAGLMKGQTPTKLAPKAKLQREQAAILLVRYFESNNSVG